MNFFFCFPLSLLWNLFKKARVTTADKSATYNAIVQKEPQKHVIVAKNPVIWLVIATKLNQTMTVLAIIAVKQAIYHAIVQNLV